MWAHPPLTTPDISYVPDYEVCHTVSLLDWCGFLANPNHLNRKVKEYLNRKVKEYLWYKCGIPPIPNCDFFHSATLQDWWGFLANRDHKSSSNSYSSSPVGKEYPRLAQSAGKSLETAGLETGRKRPKEATYRRFWGWVGSRAYLLYTVNCMRGDCATMVRTHACPVPLKWRWPPNM